jgi:hypothetical protein
LAGDFEEGFDPDTPIADEMLLDREYEATLVTTKWKDGVVLDYRLNYLPGRILSLGPHLLNVLPRREPDPLLHDREEEFGGGAFLDLTTQNLSVWNRSTLDPRYLKALTVAWGGWHVTGHVDGMVHQVVLSGRDPSRIIVPQDEAIARLMQALTVDGPRTPTLVNLTIAAATEVAGAKAQIAPGFFDVPGQIISAEERRHILQRLFHTLA